MQEIATIPQDAASLHGHVSGQFVDDVQNLSQLQPSPLGNVITIDDERIKHHLDRVIRGSVCAEILIRFI
jgi:hypothetical protein